MDFLSDKIAERLGGRDFGRATRVYKFARIKQAKAEAKRAHPDVPLIDMGVGEPDIPADPAVVEALAQAAGRAENRQYTDNGISAFQEAAARYLERVYGLKGLDPYAAITFDGHRPLSFLSATGADEVGIEVHSLSKAFNMTGWRLAFAAGNARAIQAYGTVKDNTDSGQFAAIQKAGMCAMDHLEITQRNCERYARRFDLLVPALREAGFNARKPGGSFYCYVACPTGTRSGLRFENAVAVSEYLIREALISTVPWDDAGAYLRFSVTFEANGYEEEKRVIEEMKRRLLGLGLVF